jgi:Tannase and feruloyl esterase
MQRIDVLAAALAALMVGRTASAATCESIRSLRVEHATITAATVVRAGTFAPRLPAYADPLPATAFVSLPDFCRVQGIIASTTDSHSEFEVWLPTIGWNGRYMGVGNGGSGGFVNYFAANGPSLVEALRDGFAASSTDTGHQAANDDFSFARGHREQRIDYHYRAVHETARAAKTIIRAFYGSELRHSYFSGCSDGGRQGLMEAQRYPADYDGVLVCGPAVHRTASVMAWIWMAQAVAAEPGAEIPQNKLAMIHGAVVAACDALDGLPDGLIAEPTRCRFDPTSLLCNGADSERCLTKPQVATLTRFYAGPRNSKGERLASGFLPGAELDPAGVISCRSCKASAFHRASIFLDGLFEGQFNLKTFDFDRDVRALERNEDAKLTNATQPNLKVFNDHGGKLIIVHGWSDGADPAMASVQYYNSVVATVGGQAVDQFFRLYMVPGVYHNASRGPGPTAFPGPMLRALERWVEDKVAPQAVSAASYKVDGDSTSGVVRTRPLCPYPGVALYKGAGSTDEADNFVCKLSN